MAARDGPFGLWGDEECKELPCRTISSVLFVLPQDQAEQDKRVAASTDRISVKK
jgi:hypothetical protein